MRPSRGKRTPCTLPDEEAIVKRGVPRGQGWLGALAISVEAFAVSEESWDETRGDRERPCPQNAPPSERWPPSLGHPLRHADTAPGRPHRCPCHRRCSALSRGRAAGT